MTAFFIGNSHMAAVAAHKNPEYSFAHTATVVTKNFTISDKFVNRVNRSTDKIISMIGGNSHNVLALTERSTPFDIIDPSSNEVTNESVLLVPYSAVFDSILLRGIRWVKSLEAVAKKFGSVVHVEPPPPIPDEDYIYNGLKEKMAEKGRPIFKITPVEIRYKLWRVQNHVFRKAGEPLGVTFVPPPINALDKAGYLDEKYWEDPTHANAYYGQLIIEQLQDLGHVTSV